MMSWKLSACDIIPRSATLLISQGSREIVCCTVPLASSIVAMWPYDILGTYSTGYWGLPPRRGSTVGESK